MDLQKCVKYFGGELPHEFWHDGGPSECGISRCAPSAFPRAERASAAASPATFHANIPILDELKMIITIKFKPIRFHRRQMSSTTHTIPQHVLALAVTLYIDPSKRRCSDETIRHMSRAALLRYLAKRQITVPQECIDRAAAIATEFRSGKKLLCDLKLAAKTSANEFCRTFLQPGRIIGCGDANIGWHLIVDADIDAVFPLHKTIVTLSLSEVCRGNGDDDDICCRMYSNDYHVHSELTTLPQQWLRKFHTNLVCYTPLWLIEVQSGRGLLTPQRLCFYLDDQCVGHWNCSNSAATPLREVLQVIVAHWPSKK